VARAKLEDNLEDNPEDKVARGEMPATVAATRLPN
jgi:hypothetical protein